MDNASAVQPIVVTMGEPGGIGGEITLKAWQQLRATGPCFYAIADPEHLSNLGAPVAIIEHGQQAGRHFTEQLPVLPIGARIHSVPGAADPQNAGWVISSIEQGVKAILMNEASAVVTNPIQKSSLLDSGFQFPGHTEFLGKLTDGTPMEFYNANARRRGTVMMIAGPSLKAIPVTVHTALRDAISTLTADRIIDTVLIANEALILDFGITKPRIAISGLNPHAGETGNLGSEEIEIIMPAIDTLKSQGLDVYGPYSADTMFHTTARDRYDVAVCMYHDQALIPAKTLSFDEGVNVTLGLPIIRTSPDHGTALDIAGKNIARPDSLIAAIILAGKMSKNRMHS